ncbi:uncharacterized protein LOC8050582 [Ixodes scapularis]|uniref:Microplusin preprotein, putative n=1 Tax=Ixodes scapularis TaxID=6945 RepID=B7PFA6_IXOSC|nr:uncharacterized protein LOC8050582 [Ixodes scapularis]EEC05278.1 microplusin preprotein, putative [Ixodes scapularis]|eukprot:XP_002433878.1 microplusin preprotein, putative [Ixodes scapularis]
MTRTVLVFAVTLLLSAVLVHGGNYLCRLSEEDMVKAMDCIHRTVKPEVAKFMERLPGNGIGHIRSLCRLGSDIDRLATIIYTEDYMVEFLKADEKCKPKE